MYKVTKWNPEVQEELRAHCRDAFECKNGAGHVNIIFSKQAVDDAGGAQHPLIMAVHDINDAVRRNGIDTSVQIVFER